MASAILSSRNESSWGQSGGGFSRKLPCSNHLNPNPNSNSPNSIPKKRQIPALGGEVKGRDADDSLAELQTSDDAFSFNQRSIESNDLADFNRGSYISFNVGSYTRSDLIVLKKRLVAELEQIRRLTDRIDAGIFRPQCHGGGNQLSRKIKKISGNKRPMPFASGKDPKRLCRTTSDNGIGNAGEIGNLMKMCRQVLTKLMKHKHSWIFNTPVNAAAMGLHDYHQVIKRPMDLGTVKSRFAKKLYASPEDFAADVRLTFNNALLYNRKGDEVHKMAYELLDRFEKLYGPIAEKYEGNEKQLGVVCDEVQGSSWSLIPTPERKGKSNSKSKSNSTPTAKKHEKMQIPENSANPSSSTNPQLLQSPGSTPSSMQISPGKPAVVRTNPGKLPKPKAKDPNKRQMSMEEKHKLGVGLQSLPEGKMPQLIQIMTKNNAHMAQEGNEIELDIEAMDTETLWELDRLVTNWKKAVSKNNRRALMVNNSAAAAAAAATASLEDNVLSVVEKTDKVLKKEEAGEEDVDIGDEMPMSSSSFPPVEIEKVDGECDNGHPTSSSSNSSSDSSSSSDSGSGGSSSGSDSDADDAQSRGLKSKDFSKTSRVEE